MPADKQSICSAGGCGRLRMRRDSMPKNIVVCCDGTGNEFGDSNSNVVKLCSTLVVDEQQQVEYYHPGVGTMGSPNARTALGKKWDVIRGLAFGYGITENISDAYRYLMQTYERDDKIYLFGFSRGAYTVRALGGLLHMYGLLHQGNEGLIPYITAQFATRTKQTQGMSHTFEVAEGFKQTYCRDILLHFVGVWDTVSSVGWISDPVIIPYTAANPIMKIGRHAVSIDERRCFFRDNLWGKPFQPGDPEFRVEQDIKQVWFAGVHSDVGGSYPEGESGLSKITLEWMLREAKLAGLRIHDDEAQRVLGLKIPAPFAPPDATDGQHESLKGAWWLVELLPHYKFDKRKGEPGWKWPPLGQRRHLPDKVVIHQSVQERLENMPAYRPKNLLQKTGTPPMVEPYVPLFPQFSRSHSPAKLFNQLDANEKVQAILNFKIDANPILQAPPDMWPVFPAFATILAVAATLLNTARQPVRWYFWLAEILVFLVGWQGFHKLYRWVVIDYYKQNKSAGQSVSSDAAQPPSPYLRPRWKAAGQFVSGLLSAAVVLHFTRDNLSYVAAAAILLIVGLMPAWATLAAARSFNALLAAWADASNTQEYRAYQAQLMERRRHAASGGAYD